MFKRRKLWSTVAAAIVLTLAVPAAMAETEVPASAEQKQPADAKAAADRYLKEHAKTYQLKADLSDLKYVTTIQTEAGHYVRYQQMVNNAPVFNRQVTVTLDRTFRNALVISGYEPYTTVQQVSQLLPTADLKAKALRFVEDQAQGEWAPSSEEYGYTIQKGVATPTYRVVVHTKAPYGAWETYIHAGSGELLRKRNLNQRVNGTGQVFLPNPVESQGFVGSLKDNNDKDSSELTKQLKSVTLLGLDGSGYLRGPYVNINSAAKTYSASNQFNYTRSNDSFEDVMVYYHIDTLQRYLQQLGFKNVNNRSIKVNVNASPDDNSYYQPSTGELTFGTGGVDDAEDAGVIAHEYGHAIQDNQVPGFGDSLEGGSMGEGFGDFLGATYEDAASSAGFGKACVAEWDATSYSSGNPPCLRRLDENKVYPRDLQNQVHADGEIWSQGLYEMAQAFGRDVATKIIIQSHFSLTPTATFKDGAKAIKQADVLLYGGQHAADIDRIWKARGIPTS